MQNASSDRIAKLTAELKEVQAMLAERQGELLRAVEGNGPGQDGMRRQVRWRRCFLPSVPHFFISSFSR